MRFRELFLRATLIAAPACCEVPETTKTIHASRDEHAAAIDKCLDEMSCLRVCSEVLDLPLDYHVFECTVLAVTADGLDLEAKYAPDKDCAMGRRPRGYIAVPRACSAGAWLARAANLEAASVVAFARLANTLARIGAPFVDDAKRAIGDELHHAALVAGLARAYGVEPAMPRVRAMPEPTLFELACDNAVAGQVGETHAALVAACQARLATDPRVAAAFAVIADDEARHAELAYRLAAWLEPRLTAGERGHVATLRAHAIANLAHDFDVDDRAVLGLPSATALAAATAVLLSPS